MTPSTPSTPPTPSTPSTPSTPPTPPTSPTPSTPRSPTLKWVIGAAIGLTLFAGLFVVWLFASPVTEDYDGTRSVKIYRGETLASVVESLVEQGILRAPQRFRFVATMTGWHRQIKPGHYAIASGISNHALLDKLRKGLQTPLRVTIPPGSRPGVVAAVLRRDLDIDSTAFRQALEDDSLLSDLGTDADHIFGYIMPETFEFFLGTGARQVVSRLKKAYDGYFSSERLARAEALNLTTDDVLILASIVEWEARLSKERPTIAAVYLNRLRINMPLQADPTVQYALMQLEGGRMRRLLFEDYKLQHPYNTYLYYGLPPGPITNPSPASVDAVLFADDHDYFYFVADGSGGHTFSRTIGEHNRAAANYRRLMRKRRREQGE